MPTYEATATTEGFDLVERVRVFLTQEVSRGSVALHFAALGTGLSLVSALIGLAIWGPDGAHQLFRDFGPLTFLAAAGVLSIGLIGLMVARREGRDGLGKWLNFWFIAGAGFIFLAVDGPFDLHGHIGGWIQQQTTFFQDIGFHQTSDALLAVYMGVGLVVAAVYWREILRHPVVLAYLGVGVLLLGVTIGIDGFAPHTSLMWVIEETVEIWGVAALVGGFAKRLQIARNSQGEAPGGADELAAA